jgi:cysteinyl-tRNA synthetase
VLLLDRPARESWEFRPELLAEAGARLDALFSAAGRPGSSAAAEDAVTDRLLDDLDVSGALDIAVTEGGDVARSLIRVLSLG